MRTSLSLLIGLVLCLFLLSNGLNVRISNGLDKSRYNSFGPMRSRLIRSIERSVLFGKKIDDEVERMGIAVDKKKVKSSKSKGNTFRDKSKSKQSATESASTMTTSSEAVTSKETTSNEAIVPPNTIDEQTSSAQLTPNELIEFEQSFGSSMPMTESPQQPASSGLFNAPPALSNIPPIPGTSTQIANAAKASKTVQRVSESGMDSAESYTPLEKGSLPPEIVFFGDPRTPPPAEAARDPKYHGKLLYWARHAYAAPRTKEERLEIVFPSGRLHPLAPKYRFTSLESLTYQQIVETFNKIRQEKDIEKSKAFISSNIDLIPPKLFLRCLTATKFNYQFKNDISAMEETMRLRDDYVVAYHQLFFPLNIEIMKAETRVMTYLAREEIREFARNWDEVEMSLHLTTLLAARLTWDDKVKQALDKIKKKIDSTVGYMAEGLRKDLMNRDFRKPGITAEVYLNASMIIEKSTPELYSRVRPEVKFIHESYFMKDDEVNEFAVKVFCPKYGMSVDQLKERLKMYDSSLSSIDGIDYSDLRLFVQKRYRALLSPEEFDLMDKWFFDFKDAGYEFETYEPDAGTLPTLVESMQRLRDTGNAFTNFAKDVIKLQVGYTDAFAGQRPKASDPSMNDWLKRDPAYRPSEVIGYEELIEDFREAYIRQSELRKEAQAKLSQFVIDRMDMQDRILRAPSKVMEFGGDDGTLE